MDTETQIQIHRDKQRCLLRLGIALRVHCSNWNCFLREAHVSDVDSCSRILLRSCWDDAQPPPRPWECPFHSNSTNSTTAINPRSSPDAVWGDGGAGEAPTTAPSHRVTPGFTENRPGRWTPPLSCGGGTQQRGSPSWHGSSPVLASQPVTSRRRGTALPASLGPLGTPHHGRNDPPFSGSDRGAFCATDLTAA